MNTAAVPGIDDASKMNSVGAYMGEEEQNEGQQIGPGTGTGMKKPKEEQCDVEQYGHSEYSLRDHFYKTLDRWPRLVAIVKCQLLFFSLILVTFFGGYAIGALEGPTEVDLNNGLMRRDWVLQMLPIQKTNQSLVELPGACLLGPIQNDDDDDDDDWKNYHGTTDSNLILGQAITALEFIDIPLELVVPTSLNVPWNEFKDFSGLVFPHITFRDIGPDTNNTMSFANPLSSWSGDLYGYAKQCNRIASNLVQALSEFTVQTTKWRNDKNDMTFNWVRCWNETELGRSNLYEPSSPTQINASKRTHQQKYFAREWHEDRERLFRNYAMNFNCDGNQTNHQVDNGSTDHHSSIIGIDEVGTSGGHLRSECLWEATKQSVLNATGANGCRVNVAASSWFWFTVMTTVGYGNAPPNTFGSRLLVYFVGWIAIVAFGGIMIVCSWTFTTIADDVFVRLKMKWLQRPVYSGPFWALLNVGIIAFIAYRIRVFWDIYATGFPYTNNDSYWFSYITVLTVGLGDFFLQPEGLFPTNVLGWTTLLLYAFICMTAFLGKFSDFVESWMQKDRETLTYHLARTDLFGHGIKTSYSKSLEILRKLSAIDESEARRHLLSARYHDGLNAENMSKRNGNRNSFQGRNDLSKTPNGDTIRQQRIRILMEKKNILTKLLKDNQSELEDRMQNNGTTEAGYYDAYFNNANTFLSHLEDLRQGEHDLESTLLRTRELRRQTLQEYENRNIERVEENGRADNA